jgi:hypothetical protein
MLSLTFTTGLLGQTKAEKKGLKTEKAEKEYIRTKELVETGDFVFEADRTLPINGGTISLVNNYNRIKLVGTNADIALPYFGNVWSGAGYSHEPGIKYKGEVENYTVSYNDKKRRTRIDFDIKKSSETHTFTFTIGRNGYTSVLVKSSARSTITYDGYLKPISSTWK